MLKLSCESVPGVRILIHVVARQQRFLYSEGFPEIIADDGKGKDASAKLAEFAVRSSCRVHARAIDPGRDLA